MDNEKEFIYKDGEKISLYGLIDPDVLTSSYDEGTDVSEVKSFLDKWSEEEGFKLLLSHRPELAELYSEAGMNIAFSGHAHGGQIRLPFIGGIIAPDQGLFPKYTDGEYIAGESALYVSRGLGNSLFPLRILNRPQIIKVTLRAS